MFTECSKLKTIILPNTITSLGKFAFKNSGLTEITIPRLVTSIGDGCFSECKYLEEINSTPYVAPTLGTNVFKNVGISVPTTTLKAVYVSGDASYNSWVEIF